MSCCEWEPHVELSSSLIHLMKNSGTKVKNAAVSSWTQSLTSATTWNEGTPPAAAHQSEFWRFYLNKCFYFINIWFPHHWGFRIIFIYFQEPQLIEIFQPFIWGWGIFGVGGGGGSSSWSVPHPFRGSLDGGRQMFDPGGWPPELSHTLAIQRIMQIYVFY